MFAPDVGGPIIGEGAAPSHAAGDFLDDPPVRLRLSRQRQEGSLAADRAVRIGDGAVLFPPSGGGQRSEEHTSELQSLMRISYAVFCLKKKNKPGKINNKKQNTTIQHK